MLLKLFLAILLLLHGALHVLGYNRVRASKVHLRGHGSLWYLIAALLLISFLLLNLGVAYWWIVGCSAILVSQLLIFWNWSLARWGTIANIILLAAIRYLLR